MSIAGGRFLVSLLWKFLPEVQGLAQQSNAGVILVSLWMFVSTLLTMCWILKFDHISLDSFANVVLLLSGLACLAPPSVLHVETTGLDQDLLEVIPIPWAYLIYFLMI